MGKHGFKQHHNRSVVDAHLVSDHLIAPAVIFVRPFCCVSVIRHIAHALYLVGQHKLADHFAASVKVKDCNIFWIGVFRHAVMLAHPRCNANGDLVDLTMPPIDA